MRSHYLFLFTSILFFAGCNLKNASRLVLDPEKQTLKPQALSEIPVDQITFKMVQVNVLQKNCVQCHSNNKGDFSNKGDVNLETYESVIENIVAVREEVATHDMPPKEYPQYALTEPQSKFILDWIEHGAKKDLDSAPITLPPQQPPVTEPPPVVTPPVVEPPPVTGPTSFAVVMEKVISTNCFQCHSEKGGNKGDVNLETYANVFENRFEMRSDIADGSMPTRRGTPLTDEQKKLILDWLDAGAIENPTTAKP